MIRVFSLCAIAIFLMGCSARQCELDGDYLQAQEVGDLVNPGNGELPARDPSYEIPPIPEQEIKASRTYTNAQGEEKSDCLDRPPRLNLSPKS